MSTIDILYEIESLPPTAQEDLQSYIAFLKFKYAKISDSEYKEIEEKVLLERYEKFKSGETTGIPYEESISRLKAKYGKVRY